MATPKRSPAGESSDVAEGKPRTEKTSPSRSRRMLRTLGLGMITGAADDDPSAIGTYASAGATIGPSFLWTAPATFPMMCAVVYLSAKLGHEQLRVEYPGLDHYCCNFRYQHWSRGLLVSINGVVNSFHISRDSQLIYFNLSANESDIWLLDLQ